MLAALLMPSIYSMMMLLPPEAHSSRSSGILEGNAHWLKSRHFLLLSPSAHSDHSLHCQSELQTTPPPPPELLELPEGDCPSAPVSPPELPEPEPGAGLA